MQKSKMAITSQPVCRSTYYLVLGVVFGDGRTNGATFEFQKSKMAVYTHCCRAQPLRQLGFLSCKAFLLRDIPSAAIFRNIKLVNNTNIKVRLFAFQLKKLTIIAFLLNSAKNPMCYCTLLGTYYCRTRKSCTRR